MAYLVYDYKTGSVVSDPTTGGMGFLPALVSAIPGLIQAGGSVYSQYQQQKAARKARRAQERAARQAQIAARKEEARRRMQEIAMLEQMQKAEAIRLRRAQIEAQTKPAIPTPYLIGGAVVTVVLLTQIL